MTLGFITFANSSYMTPSRILKEASDFKVFDSIRHYTEHDIPEFIEKHKAFITANYRGYGCWIWKPKIILDALLGIADGDMLIYCDAGMSLNIGGISRFHEYVEYLNDPNTSMVLFSANSSYVPQRFVKYDAISAYSPEFVDRTHYTRYHYAGVIMMKKTETTLSIIRDWLMLCENHHFLDLSPSVVGPECADYVGNDCDNGLFNLVLSKYSGSYHSVYPDETNLYTPSGEQLYNAEDWSSLAKFPFHYTRLSPRLFQNRCEMVESRVPKNGVYAEIGVFKGDFSKFLLDRLQPKQLVLIDLFTGIMGSGDQDGNNFQYANLNGVYTSLLRTRIAHPNLKIMKGDSVASMSSFPDDTFDMIYIDADHSYEGAKRDIEIAYRKLKNGGWLMGHDYEMNMNKAHQYYTFGVKRAVDEFCATHNQTIDSKGLDGCVSFAIKIRKAS